mmetsp:Transcript_32976/g.38809  ORF Transcript_32976/g.38809 Transcript_32976/m.38809 type:complete len:116 (+) Transcript_32976:1111-1458(+)
MLLLLVALIELDASTLQPLVLQHKLLSLGGNLVVNAVVVVSKLLIALGLLEHAEFEAADLVFNVFVVLLGFATVDHLPHQLLQLFVTHHPIVLLLLPPWVELVLLLLLLLLLLVL